MNLRCFPLIPLLALAACMVGPSAEKFPPAQTAEALRTTVQLERDASVPGTIEGELLEVRDSGLVVLASGRLLLVPYGRIRRAEFDRMKRLGFGQDGPPDERRRDELRLLSRFPQGISDEVLRKLLEAHRQAELEVVE